VHTIEFAREKVRTREGGYAIDIYGTTRFLKNSPSVSLTFQGASVRVTLSRSEFDQLTARPKTYVGNDLPREVHV
jgi:hypothetical protein